MNLLEKTEHIIEFGGTYQGVPSNIKDAIEIRDLWLDAAWPDILTMQQALLEIRHAQNAGPGWYTNGEPGLKKQVRLWLDKGLKASESLNKLRGES